MDAGLFFAIMEDRKCRDTTMSIGLVGRKCGMSRVFTEDGRSVPVTLIEATPNRVTQVKTVEVDGYSAIQVTAGAKRAALVNKPHAGHYSKAKVEAGRGLWEFRVEAGDLGKFAVGGELKADELFTIGQKVDVAGVSKGKGFQGTIKRHHFSMGDATHGNSLSHRSPGSIGQRQTPGRVFPGKKMAGQMGNVNRSSINLEVVKIDTERHLIAIKGAVPGAPGGNVIIRPAVKTK
jgi:large subunit ribosomal protein L3